MNTVTKLIAENENSVTWYEVNGTDYGTGYEFNSEVIGVDDIGRILDCDGVPCADSDMLAVASRNALKL